ncbi:MAG: class I SAM-dependent methyltransferase [Melioribacteraceae bacterium]|nr:class I SAM-dependent methyltransferase [Melioribacteraceae bacterium]MDD3557059.1 class I SAM-dependent methyltransferase [Melioribacteraceae bacterium]
MNCIICSNESTDVIYKNYPGYVEGSFYDIYHCSKCNINFIDPNLIDTKIYDGIYSGNEHFGYHRYKKYVSIAKKEDDPLLIFAKIDSVYYTVEQYLKENDVKKILEIGSGYGYLTYALRKRGYEVLGTDISRNAVETAQQLFGGKFIASAADELKNLLKEKYDLIIASEVIEHVKSPIEFVKNLAELLSNNGSLLLTTPNKDFSKRAKIWRTAHPPVHISWLSYKSFEEISKLLNLSCSKISYAKYYPNHENRFIKYIRQGRELIEPSLIKKDGSLNEYWERINYTPKWNKFDSSAKNLFRVFMPELNQLETFQIFYIIFSLNVT